MSAPGPPRPPALPRVASLRGWSSRQAAAVTAGLAFAAATGLWIWLAPFAVLSQIVVLAHTAAGLALVAPFARHQFRHLRDWGRQRPTAALALGYAALAAAATAGGTGVALAWQAWVGPRLGPTLDLVHLVSGLAVAGLLAGHLLSAWGRRRAAGRGDRQMAAAMRRFAVRTGGLAVAVAAAVGAVDWAVPAAEDRPPLPPGYRLPAFSQRFAEYRGNPFAPTFARTGDLALVSPRLLAGSATCGAAGCHEQVLAEWEPSAHRFAAMNPPFQAVQRRFAAERESAETRYCAGCHDPISLFAGAKDPSSLSLSAPGVEEGISCAVCHSISQVDERGNADYVLTPPRPYLGERAAGGLGRLGRFLIRAYPRQHLADYDRNVLRTPEFCGACHKQFIPEALNRFGLVASQNQYDEWKNGHWHTDEPATDLSCRDCHMRLVAGSRDPGRGEAGDRRRSAGDAAHRHHGFIATNNFMPRLLGLPQAEEQVRLTEEWIRGETVLPEIDAIWPRGPVAGIEIVAPVHLAAGGELVLRVLVTNRKAGHNFITGPLDFIRSWVHLTVDDAAGRRLGEWGAVDPATRHILDGPGRVHEAGNRRDEGTLVLESLPVDERGEPLRRHELWRTAGGRGKRVIFPTYSDAHLYRLRLPSDARGPLSVRAALEYRRYRQEFLDLVLPGLEREAGVHQAAVTQSAAERQIRLDPRPAAGAAAGLGPVVAAGG